MGFGFNLALLGAFLGFVTVIARLAVDPLRGRPLAQASAHIMLLSAICAAPEAASALAMAPGPLAASAVVEVALISNLIAVAGLALGEALTGGRLLARAGLDQLLGMVAAAVMTMATAGAVLIESTDPTGAPFGHVLSVGLLVACIVHLKWTAAPAPGERTPNPRAPMSPGVPLSLMSLGVVCLMIFVMLIRSIADRFQPVAPEPVDPALCSIAALAALPELAILWRAVRVGRADVGCAILLGGITLDLAAMALVDLADVQRAAYRMPSPVLMVAVACTTTVVLAALGKRLLDEERIGGGQSDSG